MTAIYIICAIAIAAALFQIVDSHLQARKARKNLQVTLNKVFKHAKSH